MFFSLFAEKVDDLYEKFIKQELLVSQKEDSTPKKYFGGALIVDGFDWTLPANTNKEPYSGLIDEDYGANVGRHKFSIVRWDETNPEYGRYDFSKLEKQLKRISPQKVLIRLEVHSACEAPKWALKKIRSSKHKSLIFWEKEYIQSLKPYIQSFAKRYASHPQVIGVQLGIGDGEYKGSCKDFSNKDGWGEFWMTPQELGEAEDNFGFTPEILFKRTIEIIDLYADAFAGNEGKLVFTGAGVSYSWTERSNEYNKFLPKISDYVFQKGIGDRDGEIEVWMRYIYKSYGISFLKHDDGTCSLEMDEVFAKKIKGRYWGTENEFYGKEPYILSYGGPYTNQPHRFLVSSLRALQMRRNFMGIHGKGMKDLDDPVYKTQDFIRYLSKTMGKQIENTPDAFVLLGERYISEGSVKGFTESGETCVNNGKISLRSFGRWLTEKSNSMPSLKVKMPENEKYWAQGAYLPNEIDYEYAARSSQRFEFDLNDELAKKRCKNGCNSQVKITYKDDVKTNLAVSVAEGLTEAIHTLGDSKIKTASFPVNSRFNNELQGYDFVVLAKDKPISVLLVRITFE